MIISFNYKDGDKCLTFDEVNEKFSNKKNPVQHKVEQSSSLFELNDPPAIRTRDTLLKSYLLTSLCMVWYNNYNT